MLINDNSIFIFPFFFVVFVIHKFWAFDKLISSYFKNFIRFILFRNNGPRSFIPRSYLHWISIQNGNFLICLNNGVNFWHPIRFLVCMLSWIKENFIASVSLFHWIVLVGGSLWLVAASTIPFRLSIHRIKNNRIILPNIKVYLAVIILLSLIA